MYTKAIDIKEFYETLSGRIVQRIIRRHIRHLWPEVKGQRILGFGYANPFLRPLMMEAERVISLMPSRQGAVFWPEESKGLVTLCNEAELPIETNSIDKMIIIHGLQDFDSLDQTLREAWRVLVGQGKLLLIVPNRSGLWAGFDHTPFGHGTPYSAGQIRHVLREYNFIPERVERALFVPPYSSRFMLATAQVWENVGQRFFNAFGGVNIVEASKQLYAGTLVGAPALAEVRLRQRQLAPVAPPVSQNGKG